tara:strand:- start:252 stop:857 length:606 start_codon:yes stop_codon:yes gene_type:complete
MPRKNKANSDFAEHSRRKSSRRRTRARNQKLDDDQPRFLVTSDAFSQPEAYQPMQGRVLSIDFGERRVGLAMSDPTGLIAQGLETIDTNSISETLASIAAIVDAKEIYEIVLGLPINMDGTTGAMAEKVEKFAGHLRERVSCNVRTWDERLTSVAARRAMNEIGMEIRGNKGNLDRISATLLLQNYLDFCHRSIDKPESHE